MTKSATMPPKAASAKAKASGKAKAASAKARASGKATAFPKVGLVEPTAEAGLVDPSEAPVLLETKRNKYEMTPPEK